MAKIFAAVLICAIVISAAAGYITGGGSNPCTVTSTSTSVFVKTSYMVVGNVMTSTATGIPPGGEYSNECDPEPSGRSAWEPLKWCLLRWYMLNSNTDG